MRIPLVGGPHRSSGLRRYASGCRGVACYRHTLLVVQRQVVTVNPYSQAVRVAVKKDGPRSKRRSRKDKSDGQCPDDESRVRVRTAKTDRTDFSRHDLKKSQAGTPQTAACERQQKSKQRQS